MRGISGQHCQAWEVFGVEVFCFVLQVPFHHLPPELQEPIEFPSCILGSVKVQELEEEVDMMLGKDTLEMVENPNQVITGDFS